MCYKILQNFFADIDHGYFLTLNIAIKTRGNALKFLVPISSENARADFFSVRVKLAIR